MFCPNCGKSEQAAKTFCRQCGIFLPDLNNPHKKEISPGEHITANVILNSMTVVVSFSLAITLFSYFLGRENVPAIIYVTAGFLIAIGAWQIQTIWRNWQLRKHFKRKISPGEESNDSAETRTAFESAETSKLLERADFTGAVPASVTERTTRNLIPNVKSRSTQTEK